MLSAISLTDVIAALMPLPAVPAAEGEPSTDANTTFSDTLAAEEMSSPDEADLEEAEETPPAPFALPVFVWRPPLDMVEVQEYEPAVPAPKQLSVAAPAAQMETVAPQSAEVVFAGTIEVQAPATTKVPSPTAAPSAVPVEMAAPPLVSPTPVSLPEAQPATPAPDAKPVEVKAPVDGRVAEPASSTPRSSAPAPQPARNEMPGAAQTAEPSATPASRRQGASSPPEVQPPQTAAPREAQPHPRQTESPAIPQRPVTPAPAPRSEVPASKAESLPPPVAPPQHAAEPTQQFPQQTARGLEIEAATEAGEPREPQRPAVLATRTVVNPRPQSDPPAQAQSQAPTQAPRTPVAASEAEPVQASLPKEAGVQDREQSIERVPEPVTLPHASPVRTEDPQPAAARPKTEAPRAVAPTPAPDPPSQPRPVDRISFTVGGTEGQPRAEVLLQHKAEGVIQMAVRTPDAQLAQALRSGLPELNANLDSRGYRSELQATPTREHSGDSQDQPHRRPRWFYERNDDDN